MPDDVVSSYLQQLLARVRQVPKDPPPSTPRLIGQHDPDLIEALAQIQKHPELADVLSRVPAIGVYTTPARLEGLAQEIPGVGGTSVALPTPFGGLIGINRGDIGDPADPDMTPRGRQHLLRDVLLHEMGHIKQGLDVHGIRNNEEADQFVKKYHDAFEKSR